MRREILVNVDTLKVNRGDEVHFALSEVGMPGSSDYSVASGAALDDVTSRGQAKFPHPGEGGLGCCIKLQNEQTIRPPKRKIRPPTASSIRGSVSRNVCCLCTLFCGRPTSCLDGPLNLALYQTSPGVDQLRGQGAQPFQRPCSQTH